MLSVVVVVAVILTVAALPVQSLPSFALADFNSLVSENFTEQTGTSCLPYVEPMKDVDIVKFFGGLWWLVDTVQLYDATECYQYNIDLQGNVTVWNTAILQDGQKVLSQYNYSATNDNAVWTDGSFYATLFTILDTDYTSYAVSALCQSVDSSNIIFVWSRNPAQVTNVLQIQHKLKMLGFDLKTWNSSSLEDCVPRSNE